MHGLDRGGEEDVHDVAPDLVGEMVVRAQKHLEQVPAADDAFQNALGVHDGQTFHMSQGHDACGLGERGVGVDGDGRGAHQLLRAHRPGLGQVGQPLQLGEPVRVAVPELLLGQQVGLGNHSDHPAVALQHGKGADLPLLHALDDVLEQCLAAHRDDGTCHHVTHPVRAAVHAVLLLRPGGHVRPRLP